MPLSRFDGRLAQDVPPYRRIMPFIMQGRTESAVYFEQTVALDRTLPRLDALSRDMGTRINVFHLLLWATARVLAERPRLNRFLAGNRLYDRDGVFLSFSMKKRMDSESPLVLVKRRFEPGESLPEVAAALTGEITRAREGSASKLDRELDILLRLPAPLLRGAVRLLRTLDGMNLAPRSLIEHDPLYTSAVLTNVGSIQMDAAFHHLYEYGNCPIFLCMGLVRQQRSSDGTIGSAMKLCITYDERIEDGYYCAQSLELLGTYLEHPESWIF